MKPPMNPAAPMPKKPGMPVPKKKAKGKPKFGYQQISQKMLQDRDKDGM